MDHERRVQDISMTDKSASFTSPADRRLRLHTLVRLRWLAVFGQLAAIGVVYLGLGFQLPLASCLIVIAVSAWINVILSVRYPARFRLPVNYAMGLLAYDILQLAALLYLTGGIENPFTLLLVAPVTVSAATLPIANTIVLGLLGIAATVSLAVWSLPLPWRAGELLTLLTLPARLVES